MVRPAGFRVALPGVRRYAVVALALLAGFYGLHWTANLVPQERSFAFVKQAFETEVLSVTKNYARSIESVRSLTGHRYSDCRALRSVIIPPSTGLAEMLAPSMAHLEVPREERGPGAIPQCRSLFENVAGSGKARAGRPLKTRYWHGAMAVTATLLHVPSLTFLQITETIKAANHFAWMLLALLAFAHSRRLFAVFAPVIVLGVFASGIPYLGAFSYGLPYLFAVLALAGLVRLTAVRAPGPVLRLWSFAAGMVSSYLFLLDGHQLLLVPVTLVVLYFGREDAGLGAWARLALGCLAAFAAGFVLSYLVNQAGKVMVLGWDVVVPGFFEHLAGRLAPGTESGEMATVGETFRWFGYGYARAGFMGNVLFAKAFLVVPLLALLAGAVGAARRAWRAGNIAPVTGSIVIAVAIGIVLARIGLFPNHTIIHNFHIGRYMFVPLALALSMPVAAWGFPAWARASPLRPPVAGGTGPRT